MTDLTNAIILRDTGREYGPDFMLNIENTAITGNNITNTSSITEVLNIVGYLCNTTRSDDSTIIVIGSIDKNVYGEHDLSGNYTAAGTAGAAGSGAAGATLYLSTATAPLFYLNSLTAAAAALPGAVIPQGILRRTQDQTDPHGPTAAIDISQAGSAALMSDCIKQMINILENTRTIFGPKGWTALFQQVKGGGGGGGGGGKNHAAKRTHHHRRRYSSKQY